MIATDRESGIVFANAQIEKFFGLAPNNLLGAHISKVLSERRRPGDRMRFRRALPNWGG